MIACLIIFPAVGLFIWSSLLLDKTFVKTSIILLPALLGGFIGTAVLTLIWRKHLFPFWVILFYGMLSGASLPTYLIAASNFYFRDYTPFQEQLDIIRTGHLPKRKGKCRTPYAVIAYDGVEKELSFPCEFEKNIFHFRQVRLELSKGFLGFEIIVNKELVQ